MRNHPTRQSMDTLPFLVPRRPHCEDEFVVDAAGISDVGRCRKHNEDQFLIARLERRLFVESTGVKGAAPLGHGQTRGRLLIVADGMGGHGGGDMASAVAMDELVQQVADDVPWVESDSRSFVLETLHAAFEHCQSRVEAVAARKGIAHQHPGTTLTLAALLDDRLYLVHAGDSRCYLYRDSRLHRLTRDHTLSAHIASASDADPAAVAGEFDHVLLNAIAGGTADLYADTWEVPLRADDVIVLCTDGLTRHLSDEQIASHIESMYTAADCCGSLLESANAAGGLDNITVVACRVLSTRSR